MQPRLERRATPAALALAVVGFFGLMSWSAWRGLGNLRDIMAFGAVIQGLSGTESDVTQSQQLAKAISNEAILGGMAILLPLLYLGIIAILARLRRVSYGMLLRRYTLSVAALLTLIYTVHLTAFALRERVVRTELQQVLHHEGRYLAKKLGTVWPTSPAP